MPTATLSTIFHSTTDADFRTWGKAVSDAIAGLGLIRGTDTGQINWATVLKPSSTTVVSGYEIWRFNDALQATAPVFIKLEYGAQVSPAFPGLYITIGRGTDGAGNITGVLAPRRATAMSNGSGGSIPTNIEPIYLSSDGSSLCFSARIGATLAPSFHAPAFVIDRSRDGSGSPTAVGGVVIVEGAGNVTMLQGSSGTSVPAQMHVWTFNGESSMGDVPAVVPAQVNGAVMGLSTTLSDGDRGLVFPYVAIVPGHAPWQVLAACSVVAADAANGPFTANVLGRVRNLRSVPIGDSHNRWMTGANTTGHTGLCILWED
ncbi:hypothetical protein [Sanguibacter inulinus]|uniref:Uncharacterized protein n=1 Tax=Sanguibacter inulinus TaxID=60922 RepID=A0A853F065_9MICO|nr:hypothetical protein [Sanguibacter inulinus]MBF0724077.1 hypothetical protein [Sanguibacter inulinus]NYS95222.1 hypothetical protein [Sanguibacter inulinus]